MVKKIILLPLLVFFVVMVYSTAPSAASTTNGNDGSGRRFDDVIIGPYGPSGESDDNDPIIDLYGSGGESNGDIIGPINGDNSYAAMLGAPVPPEFFAPPNPDLYDEEPTAYEDYAFVPVPSPGPEPIDGARHT
ncbi:hypothetical protein OROHE_022849 [Orobanche hederae]